MRKDVTQGSLSPGPPGGPERQRSDAVSSSVQGAAPIDDSRFRPPDNAVRQRSKNCADAALFATSLILRVVQPLRLEQAEWAMRRPERRRMRRALAKSRKDDKSPGAGRGKPPADKDYSHCDMAQPLPQQLVAPQLSWTGQAGLLDEDAEWAAGTLSCLLSWLRPHDGHDGLSSPRTRYSNCRPQSRQTYS
mgnify:CR=1 FL=1